MAAAANPVNTPPPPPIKAEPAHHDAVCLAIDGGHPRAWVASVDDNCTTWRALSRDKDVLVDFDPHWFKRRCAYAAGKMYWHIRVLMLDPATLRFSYLLAPAELSDRFCTYRVMETPEDGRLRIMAMASRSRQLQLWVRGEGQVQRQQMASREGDGEHVHRVEGAAGPAHRPCKQDLQRLAQRHGRRAHRQGLHPVVRYGRYSLHLDTVEMERLATEDGREWGHPIFAYFPAFLAKEY